MTTKRKYQSYNKEFKEGALALIYDQNYSVSDAASAVGITTSLLYNWKQKQDELANSDISADELEELKSLRKEVKTLRMKKEILKKASVDSIGQRNTYVKISGRHALNIQLTYFVMRST